MRNFRRRGRSGIAATASKEEVHKRHRHRRPISRRSTTLVRAAGNVQHFAQRTDSISAGNGRNIRDVVGWSVRRSAVGSLHAPFPSGGSFSLNRRRSRRSGSRIQSMSMEWDHIRRQGRVYSLNDMSERGKKGRHLACGSELSGASCGEKRNSSASCLTYQI